MYKRRFVFHQSSPVQPVSDDRGSSLSLEEKESKKKSLCLIWDAIASCPCQNGKVKFVSLKKVSTNQSIFVTWRPNLFRAGKASRLAKLSFIHGHCKKLLLYMQGLVFYKHSRNPARCRKRTVESGFMMDENRRHEWASATDSWVVVQQRGVRYI